MTDGGNQPQVYNQGSTGRLGGDFGVDDSHTGTKIYFGGDKDNEDGTLYYGLHSGIYGVNYEINDEIKINLEGTAKSGVEVGEYTVTVTMYAPIKIDKDTKHKNSDTLKVIKSVDFTFRVK